MLIVLELLAIGIGIFFTVLPFYIGFKIFKKFFDKYIGGNNNVEKSRRNYH